MNQSVHSSPSRGASPSRIAVIAALNLANELIKVRKHGTVVEGDLGARLKSLRERVETALAKGQQLEL